MDKSLRECISDAQRKGVALGHFNASNIEAVHAIVRAAEKLHVPVIIGVTEGEQDFFGGEEIVAVVKALNKVTMIPIFLNADHHYSFESVKKAIDLGFDMAIIDGAAKSHEENVEMTRKCVEYAKEVSKKTERDILIEAELGFIGQSSKVLEFVPDGVSEETMTQPEEARKFVLDTGIDLFAPSVGNIHGIVKTGEPSLHPERVKQISDATNIPLVLHGASGNTNNDIQSCISAGVAIVHINTEIRIAYKEALKIAVTENNEVAPYKYLPSAVSAIQKVVEEKLRVFNFL